MQKSSHAKNHNFRKNHSKSQIFDIFFSQTQILKPTAFNRCLESFQLKRVSFLEIDLKKFCWVRVVVDVVVVVERRERGNFFCFDVSFVVGDAKSRFDFSRWETWWPGFHLCCPTLRPKFASLRKQKFSSHLQSL